MGRLAETGPGFLFGKCLGSDNVWNVYFAFCKVCVFARESERWAQRTVARFLSPVQPTFCLSHSRTVVRFDLSRSSKTIGRAL
jgi:hypothetical protein